MNLKASLILPLILSACATAPAPKNTVMRSPRIESTLVQIEKTIRNLKHEIEELQSLEEDAFSKSLAGDPALKERLRKHENQYGNLDSLEAAIKALSELKEELEKAG